MFVPVSCTSCGKPFQVPEAALGKLAPCPWCQEVVTALPVAAPLPAPDTPPPEPVAAPAAAEPSAPAQEPVPKPKPIPGVQVALSLDDAATRPAEPKPDHTRPPEPRAKAKYSLAITLGVGVIIVLLVTAATLAYRHYGSGRLPEGGWSEYTAPDGSFTIALPGRPAEEEVGPNPPGSVTGGRRFTVAGWYSKTKVWVAYNDLDPTLVPKLAADRDRVIGAGVLQAEREREKARIDGAVNTEVMIREIGASWGVELHLDTPRGKVVMWIILVGEGPRPRVYVFGVEAKDINPKNPAARRLYNSFRLNN